MSAQLSSTFLSLGVHRTVDLSSSRLRFLLFSPSKYFEQSYLHVLPLGLIYNFSRQQKGAEEICCCVVCEWVVWYCRLSSKSWKLTPRLYMLFTSGKEERHRQWIAVAQETWLMFPRSNKGQLFLILYWFDAQSEVLVVMARHCLTAYDRWLMLSSYLWDVFSPKTNSLFSEMFSLR